MMSFKDVWTLPFKKDPGGYCSYIWDSKNHMCFNFLSNDINLYNRVVALLNDKTDAIPFKGAGRNEECIVVSDDTTCDTAKPCLLVRGWGHLTGCGALHLSSDEAVKLQDELMDYCVSKLRGK